MADQIRTLAANMVARKQASREPYVLVLGAGASLSSGCTSYSDLVDDFLQQRCADDLEKLNRKRNKQTREEAKRERFYTEWRSMSGINRYSFLKKHLGGDPSPGYEHLAWLVRHGYVGLIFSTNLDAHVERAFTAAGLAPNQDYEPLTNGPGKSADITRRLEAPTPLVKLVKLHGTLSDEDSYAWLPEDTSEFEEELEDALRFYLNKDVIILGHRMDDRDLDLQFRMKGGEIWFANPGGASETRFKAILGVRAQSRTLDGDAARFDDFLAALRIQLEAFESGAATAAEEPDIHRFLRAIGLPSQINEPRSRYLHLPELYVKPEEYETIRTLLDQHHAVVIAGEPHMGKTYTALHLLWERFQEGWTVVHMKRDALAGALQQCGHHLEEFASRHLSKKCLLHLDDPFGETEYQSLGPLQKELSGLVHEVRRRGDCALILTSRIGIFAEAMGHLEGAALFRGMGVEADIRVHTSYSQETRREVLERYLNLYQPPWAADATLRATALAQVPGILEAPHNLELFARRSEGISEEKELLDFALSCREIITALAQWISRLPAEQQLILLLTRWYSGIYFPVLPPSDCGAPITALRSLHRSTLAHLYQQRSIEAIPVAAWELASERLGEVVIQSRGQEHDALSFVHPSYREAVEQLWDPARAPDALMIAAIEEALQQEDIKLRVPAAHCTVVMAVGVGDQAQPILRRVAEDGAPEVRAWLGIAGGLQYVRLAAGSRQLVVSLLRDESELVRSFTLVGLAAAYGVLDPEAKGSVIRALKALTPNRNSAAIGISLGGAWRFMNSRDRQAIRALVLEQLPGLGEGVAEGLAFYYEKTDADGRALLQELSDRASAETRQEVVRRLAHNHQNLDEEGRKLLEQVRASLPDE